MLAGSNKKRLATIEIRKHVSHARYDAYRVDERAKRLGTVGIEGRWNARRHEHHRVRERRLKSLFQLLVHRRRLAPVDARGDAEARLDPVRRRQKRQAPDDPYEGNDAAAAYDHRRERVSQLSAAHTS